MKKVIITLIYLINIIIISGFLLLDIIGTKRLNNLNLTLLIVLTIFTTMIFGELVIKDLHHERKNKKV